ncbi:S1 family peptidase [Spirosoma validum]|uniref:Trypsin-like peptidase domain-containing protein n=1 Tax=Spirosoma validum TaxID=2771355 RepID=A0A927B1K4_9BACT|nr:serine protease [Spirosoma validum]MBD2753733.1 trypsin-like peptidase domain-containing protein [Spirosoma validum]
MREITNKTVYFENRTGGTFELDTQSIGYIQLGNGRVSGSAFVIDTKRQVVTCAHVIDRNQDIYFVTSASEGSSISTYKLRLIKYLFGHDLALLESDEDLCEIPLTASDDFNIQVGEFFCYAGFDTYLSELPRKVASQIHGNNVLSVGKTKLHEDGPVVDYFEHLGKLKPGYSGGPNINLDGKVVAVSTKAWQEHDFEGNLINFKNFAVSIAPVLDISPFD